VREEQGCLQLSFHRSILLTVSCLHVIFFHSTCSNSCQLGVILTVLKLTVQSRSRLFEELAVSCEECHWYTQFLVLVACQFWDFTAISTTQLKPIAYLMAVFHSLCNNAFFSAVLEVLNR
jgi:hypothetical protein